MEYLHPFKFLQAGGLHSTECFLVTQWHCPFNSDLFLQGIYRINLTVELAFGVIREVFVLAGLYFSLMVSQNYKRNSRFYPELLTHWLLNMLDNRNDNRVFLILYWISLISRIR